MVDFHFDEQTLLHPISEESPAGESLRFSPIYDRIREAQREDDTSLGRGVWTFSMKRADWSEVERLCLEALTLKAKDLQVTATLVTAWTHLYGFAGLREGLRVMTGLVNAFSAELFTVSEADDLDYQVSPLDWLNEKLSIRIKLTPITRPTGTDADVCSFAAWEAAARPQAKHATEKGGQANFEHSALLTPTEHFVELLRDLQGSLEALAALEAALTQRLEAQAPSLRRIWSVLESIRDLVAGILDQREVPMEEWLPTPVPSSLSFERVENEEAGVPAYPHRPIRSRDEAYQLLAEAADYLARTEPHSPTPYLVKRAITWGSMTFDALLPELVRNSAELAEIFRLLQIQTRPK